MDNTGLLPSGDVALSPPMRGRLAPQGLGTRAHVLLYGGGLPSLPSSSEPSGDAGEGRDVPVRISPTKSRDSSYRPHPNLPSANELDYVHKAIVSPLLLLGFLLLLAVAILNPRRALGLIGRGAEHHAGMR